MEGERSQDAALERSKHQGAPAGRDGGGRGTVQRREKERSALDMGVGVEAEQSLEEGAGRTQDGRPETSMAHDGGKGSRKKYRVLER
jgi:hypothetical protein